MKGMGYLKRVDIGFDFFSGRSAGPRYVADRLLSQKARVLNPAVVVNVNVHNRRTLPEVKVQFIDGNTQEYSGGMTGVQIIDQIEQTTSKMMLDKLLSRKWREEEVVTEMNAQLIRSIVYGVGRRHRPKKSDRESLLAVFAPDLAEDRVRSIDHKREASRKRQEDLAAAGVEHY